MDEQPLGHDDAGSLLRSTLPGRHARTVPSDPTAGARLLERVGEGGRRYFEWTIILAALALLFPWIGVGAVITSLLARAERSPRWGRAMVAAVWCLFLGSVARRFFGFPLAP